MFLLLIRRYLFVFVRIPSLLLPLQTGNDDVLEIGRIRLHLEVIVAQVAFHPEELMLWNVWWVALVLKSHGTLVRHKLSARETPVPEFVDGGRVVLPGLGLFRIVSDSHPDMIPASKAPVR